MNNDTWEVVICGAGIAGISAAYQLALQGQFRKIVLVDPLPPLSLTSDKSTECYRNWWPGPDPAMVSLMNRSIDLLEALASENANRFRLNQRGYLYLTGDESKLASFRAAAEIPPGLGAGPLRIHPRDSEYLPSQPEGFPAPHGGADLILDQQILRREFPYLTTEAVAALHVRRAGWFSSQQLGMLLLESARRCGVELITDQITAIQPGSGQTFQVTLASGRQLSAGIFVNAAGPYIKTIAAMLGLELPVRHELHLKAAISDPLAAVDRHAPLLIWTDPQYLPWQAEEIQALQEDSASHWLLAQFPGGVHTRPEGSGASQTILMLWEYRVKEIAPTFPLPLDPLYPEIALRGLTRMIPALGAYLGRMPKPYLDGGYYTKTPENRPLIGPLPLPNLFISGAYSGYGLMAALASGELLAQHILGAALPAHARAFSFSRYADPAYRQRLAAWGSTGQL